MDERTWNDVILRLYEYYRVEKLPTKEQQRLWFEQIKHIGNLDVTQIFNNITNEFDSLPRNLPKAFKANRPTGSQHANIIYNQERDDRFPVGLMWNAFHILEEKGDQAFVSFVKSVNMPRMDIERVRNKSNLVHKKIRLNLPEVGHRTNPKTTRPDVITYREPGEE